MEALHEPTWRKAGIFEAIKASTFKIHKNPSLIQALVEKWCPETKSFVFPWGEATVTLEDVMVLLGFSVLGSPVVAPLENSEMRDAVDKLEKAKTKILAVKGGQVSQLQWTSRFRDRGGDESLEHEAFLAMWLSVLVFPDMSRRSISKHVFPVAVRLARGERIALAPAVLAGVYRDLSRISGFGRGDCDRKLNSKSLLKLVQVWTWERFKNVRPKAKKIPKGEPRISRWDGLQKEYENVRLSLDDFEWRPYTKPLHNWNPLRVYVEEAMWVTVDNSLDDEFVAFARCVRSSKLVGIGFVEDYYPNRVAMQFGFSQDLPGLVTHHSNFTEKEAWDDYNKSLVGLKLYMPSRLAAGSVTTRYRDWWLKSVSRFLGFEESNETSNASNKVDDDASPEVLPLSQVLQKLGEGFPAKFKRSRKLRIARRMGSEIEKCKIGDCGASVSVDVPLSELFHKELAKRTSEDLRDKRGKKKDGGDASGSLGIRRRDNNDSRICQELASGDAETLEPQEIEKTNEEGTRSEAEETVVMISFVGDTVLSPPKGGQICVDVNESNNPEKKKILVEDAGDTSESLGRRRDKEYNNDSRICQELAYGDDEAVAPQEIEPHTEEETRSVVEEIPVLIPCVGDTVMPPLNAGQTCDDVKGSNNPEKKKKKKTVVDAGTKEAECLLRKARENQRSNEMEERLKQRKLTTEELALTLEARMMKVEKTLATIRNWKTKINHFQTGVSA
ncbi:hypothetical protein Bca4012_063906 [Brassica carinata]